MVDQQQLSLPTELWTMSLVYANNWPTRFNFRNVCQQFRSIVDRTTTLPAVPLDRLRKLMSIGTATVEDQMDYIINVCDKVIPVLGLFGDQLVPAVQVVVSAQSDALRVIVVQNRDVSSELAMLIGQCVNLISLVTGKSSVSIDLTNLTKLQVLEGNHNQYVNCTAKLSTLALKSKSGPDDRRDFIKMIQNAGPTLCHLSLDVKRRSRRRAASKRSMVNVEMPCLTSLYLHNQQFLSNVKIDLRGASSLDILELMDGAAVKIPHFRIQNHDLTRIELSYEPQRDKMVCRLAEADAESLDQLESLNVLGIPPDRGQAIIDVLSGNCSSLEEFTMTLQPPAFLSNFNAFHRLVINARCLIAVVSFMFVEKDDLIRLIVAKASSEIGLMLMPGVVTDCSRVEFAAELLVALRNVQPMIEKRNNQFILSIRFLLDPESDHVDDDDDVSSNILEEFGIEFIKGELS